MVERLINLDRSVVVAADVDAEKLAPLAQATSEVPGIGGYKIGLALGLELGLPETVRRIRQFTDRPIIYDHQKAGNDIPAMGSEFARVCKRGGVDAVIFFPFSSPVTELDWVKAAQDQDLGVLVGGHMTVPKFLESEGGYIADSAPKRIYRLGAENGVKDFVVPGNKVKYVEEYRQLLEKILGSDNFTLWAPGFITQLGEISEFAKAAGSRWHAIVGSAIYKAGGVVEMALAAQKMTAQLKAA